MDDNRAAAADGPAYGMADDAAQRWLMAEFTHRRRRVARGLLGQTVTGSQTSGFADVTAPVVLRVFDPGALVRGAVRFAAALAPDQADSWFRCYTRAFFLFGNPRNLAARHALAASAGDNSIGWLGLVDRDRLVRLRRLLRPVSGRLPEMTERRVTTGPERQQPAATEWDLWIATRGLDAARYLVHLHHTVAEAVLTGRLRGGDAIRLRHVTDISPSAAHPDTCAYARVHVSQHDPRRLRLYALLCQQS